jgi:hypothetical protein
MPTPEARAKQIQRATDDIGRQLSAIEAKLGLDSPTPPPIPTAPIGPDGKSRKTLRTLEEIARRLSAIERAAGPRNAAEPRPANPGDVRRANSSLRGDPAPPPLRKDR